MGIIVEKWGKQIPFLSGEHRHGLDEKRRLALPARLRQNQRRWVMARGWEGCLALYTEVEWKKLIAKLDSLPVANKVHARAFKPLQKTAWQNSILLKGDVAEAVAGLKEEAGKDIYMFGSGDLCQTLMRHNLIDEYLLRLRRVIIRGSRRARLTNC
jgi:hypothetical protein